MTAGFQIPAVAAIALAIVAAVVGPAAACSPETDCMIGDRTYRIQVPQEKAEPFGALIYAHGYKGSAKAVMRNKALRALADELGLALVAAKSASIDWLIPGVPENPAETGQTELAYFDALIDDLEARHGIDRTRLVAAGFSAGGMMVWNLACYRANVFAAFVPIAGTFWRPVPESCPGGPVNLVHVHGLADRIVPLAGRPIGRTHQGDIPTALNRARIAGGFGAAQTVDMGTLLCQRRTNPTGKLLAFCTHEGGHSLKTDYLRVAWALLREVGAVR